MMVILQLHDYSSLETFHNTICYYKFKGFNLNITRACSSFASITLIAPLEFLFSLQNDCLNQFLASIFSLDHCLLHVMIELLLSFECLKEHSKMKFNDLADFIDFLFQNLLRIFLDLVLMMVVECLIHFELFLDYPCSFISYRVKTKLTY